MYFLKSIFLIFLLLGTCSSAQDKDNPLNLTKQEQAFIKNNPIIRVSNEDDWQPFDFSKNGKAKGYSVDIIKNLAKKIGVKIEFVNGYTWSELLKLFDDGKIDMLHVMRKNKSRVKKYNYSEPYITWHGAYFITEGEQTIKSIKNFDNKKIGLIKGWGTTKIFKEKFPKAFAVEYKNISDLLIALSLKEVDAIISMISTARYTMKQELITNVKLGGYVNINDFIIDNKLYFASQKDKPEIVSIFNKALNLLTIEEKNILYYKWFGNKEEKITVELTVKEQRYIKNHPVLTVGNDKNWAPFDFYENGQAKGFSIDYIKEVGKLTGFKFKFVQEKNWALLINKLKTKELDILTALEVTANNQQFALFSDDILMTFESMVIRDDHTIPDSYKDLYGKRVGVIKGYDFENEIRKNHTPIDMVLFDTPLEALQALSDNQIDVFLENSTVASYLINKHFLTNLKLGASPKFPNIDNGDRINISSRIDHPQLHSIIQKAIKAMPDKTIKRLHDKWISTINNSNQKQTVILTKDEQIYLKKKKEIKMCVDPDWMPLEKIRNGEYIGIGADYIKIFQDKLGISITLVPTKTWVQSVENIKQRKCDILPLSTETPSRKPYMNFTQPYIDLPFVIATTYDKLFISNTHQLEGKSIGIVRGYAEKELLQNKYPNIHFIDVENVNDGLQQVAQDKLFGFVENLTVMGYQIQKGFSHKLKISGKLDEKFELSVGMRNDEPLLVEIFNKTLKSVNDKTKQQILNQWISIKYDKGFDYTLFWYILTPLFILGLLLLVHYYMLKQYNRRLKNEVTQKVEELRHKDEILLKKHRMAEMGEMLSMIAHQWKQPLGAINAAIMGIEVKMASGRFNLNNENDRKKFVIFLEKKLHNINDYVQHLSITTDDFRNFFNPNKMKARVPLTAPIESALMIIQKSMENNGIKIIKDFKVDTEIELYQNEVLQVILNLLKNSEDNFLEKNISDPKITIATYTHNDKYIINICDNGGGIPEDIVDKILDPYFSTKGEKNGSGLGLYMSNIIIEDHHKATLNIKNTNDGVCFEIIVNEQIIQ